MRHCAARARAAAKKFEGIAPRGFLTANKLCPVIQPSFDATPWRLLAHDTTRLAQWPNLEPHLRSA